MTDAGQEKMRCFICQRSVLKDESGICVPCLRSWTDFQMTTLITPPKDHPRYNYYRANHELMMIISK